MYFAFLAVLLYGGDCGKFVKAAGGQVVTQDPVDLDLPFAQKIICYLTFEGFKYRHKVRFVLE